MTVAEMAGRLELTVVTSAKNQEPTITGVYVCDLLSWAMSHAKQGDAWITVVVNLNTIAVALLTRVACIIVPEDAVIEPMVIEKAREENMILLRSHKTAYQISMEIYELFTKKE